MRKKIVSPGHRREAARTVVAAGMCSGRAVCRYLGLARSTYVYHGSTPTPREEQLRQRLLALSLEHPRYGYRRIAALLRREGWQVGKRHIQRLRRAEGLRVPPTKRKVIRRGAVSYTHLIAHSSPKWASATSVSQGKSGSLRRGWIANFACRIPSTISPIPC